MDPGLIRPIGALGVLRKRTLVFGLLPSLLSVGRRAMLAMSPARARSSRWGVGWTGRADEATRAPLALVGAGRDASPAGVR